MQPTLSLSTVSSTWLASQPSFPHFLIISSTEYCCLSLSAGLGFPLLVHLSWGFLSLLKSPCPLSPLNQLTILHLVGQLDPTPEGLWVVLNQHFFYQGLSAHFSKTALSLPLTTPAVSLYSLEIPLNSNLAP